MIDKPLRQFIIKMFCKYINSLHFGKDTSGIKEVAKAIGRMLLFGSKGKLNLSKNYVSPCWGRVLKALKGVDGRFWRDHWIDKEEGKNPSSTFYNAKIPARVARNITPGKVEPFESRGLVRVNRAQVDGVWISNIYFFSPDFLEWLACCKKIPVELINDLVDWINLQQDSLCRFIPKEQPKEQPKTDQEVASVDQETSENQKNFGSSTVYKKEESIPLSGDNMKCSDLRDLGEKSSFDVESCTNNDQEGKFDYLWPVQGLDRVDSEEPTLLQIKAEFASPMPTIEQQNPLLHGQPYQQELALFEGIARQATDRGYTPKIPLNSTVTPINEITWLEKNGCSGLASICKKLNQQKIARAGAVGGAGGSLVESLPFLATLEASSKKGDSR